MKNQWFINSSRQIEHRMTRETSEFGLNGELYDVIPEGENAGFIVLITNTAVAQRLVRSGITQYPAETKTVSGEELVLRRPIKDLDCFKKLLDIPSMDHQLAIANRR